MKISTFVLLNIFAFINLNSQEIVLPEKNRGSDISLISIVKLFEQKNDINFSYDYDRLKEIKIAVKNQFFLSISNFESLLGKQTNFELVRKIKGEYLIVQKKPHAVCGKVIDGETGESILGAIIKKEQKFYTTDNQGIFQLEIQAVDTIEVSLLGYKKRKIPYKFFRAKPCAKIVLIPEISVLDEVVISDYLTEGITKNKDASVVLDLKKLKILPGLVEPDIFQSSQLLPGISSSLEDPASINVRGGSPDQNLVIVDGIKMYTTGHFFNQISLFNPNVVKSINIFRGGTSVQYGDRISGVFDIETDDDLFDRVKAGGGANFSHLDVYTKIPLSGNMGILLAARKSSTDLYDNAKTDQLYKKVFQGTRGDRETFSENSFNNDLSFYDINIKWIWKIKDNHKLTVSNLFARNKFKNTTNQIIETGIDSFIGDVFEEELGFEEDEFFEEFLEDISSEEDFEEDADINIDRAIRRNIDSNKEESMGTSITYEFGKPNRNQHVFQSYSSTFENNSVTRIVSFFPEEEKDEEKYNRTNTIIDLGISYRWKAFLGKQIQFNSGYQFSHQEVARKVEESFLINEESIEKGESENSKSIGNNQNIFTEFYFDNKKILARLGLRSTYLSNTNSFFVEPRIYTSLTLFKNFKLTSSLEQKNQQIMQIKSNNLEESNIILPNLDTRWVLAGPLTLKGGKFDIPVVQSTQITFGLNYHRKTWHIDFEGYYKKLHDITLAGDLLLFLDFSGEGQLAFTGNEKRIGYDFLIKKRAKNWRFWLGYSWLNTEITLPLEGGISIPNTNDQRHILNVSQTLKVKNFEFAIGWQYASGRPFSKINRTLEIDTAVDEKGHNGHRIDAYQRMDTSILYRFNSKSKKREFNGLMGVSFRNLLSNQVSIDQNVVFNSDNETILEGAFPFFKQMNSKSLRFTPDVVLRVNF